MKQLVSLLEHKESDIYKYFFAEKVEYRSTRFIYTRAFKWNLPDNDLQSTHHAAVVEKVLWNGMSAPKKVAKNKNV